MDPTEVTAGQSLNSFATSPWNLKHFIIQLFLLFAARPLANRDVERPMRRRKGQLQQRPASFYYTNTKMVVS